MPRDFSGPNPKPVTSGKITRKPPLADRLTTIRDQQQKGIPVTGPGLVSDQNMDGRIQPLDGNAAVFVFKAVKPANPSSRGNGGSITSKGEGGDVFTSADNTEKLFGLASSRERSRSARPEDRYGLTEDGQFEMMEVEATSPLSMESSGKYRPVLQASGIFDLSLEIEKMANFVQFLKAIENGSMQVGSKVLRMLVDKTIPAQMKKADLLQGKAHAGRDAPDNAPAGLQAELNESAPIDAQIIDEAVAGLIGNQSFADAITDWRARIFRPGSTQINVTPKTGRDSLIPGTTKQAYEANPAEGQPKFEILYGGETSEPAIATTPMGTPDIPPGIAQDVYPTPVQNINQGVGFTRAATGTGSPPPARALNLGEINLKTGSLRLVNTPVDIDGATKQYPVLTFERSVVGDKGEFAKDSNALAVEIYLPRDKTKPITHFGANKLSGQSIDLSGTEDLGPIIRDANGDVYRLNIEDEASGQIGGMTKLEGPDASEIQRLYEIEPASYPEVANAYAANRPIEGSAPEGSFGQFPITRESISNTFDLLQNYFKHSPSRSGSGNTALPDYSVMRENVDAFAETQASGEYFNFDFKTGDGTGSLEGKQPAEIASLAVQGNQEAINWVQNQVDYEFPETIGGRHAGDKGYAAGKVIETKKVLDEIMRLEAEGEPVGTMDDPTGRRPSKSQAQRAYDEALEAYESMDGEGYPTAAELPESDTTSPYNPPMAEGEPMPAIINQLLETKDELAGLTPEPLNWDQKKKSYEKSTRVVDGGRPLGPYNRKITHEDIKFLMRELTAIEKATTPYELGRDGQSLSSGTVRSDDALRATRALGWIEKALGPQYNMRESRVGVLKQQQIAFLEKALKMGQLQVDRGLAPPEVLLKAQESLRKLKGEEFEGGFPIDSEGVEGGSIPFPSGITAFLDQSLKQYPNLVDDLTVEKGLTKSEVSGVLMAALREDRNPTATNSYEFEAGDPSTIPPPDYTTPKDLKRAIKFFNAAMPEEAKSNIFSEQRRDSTSIRANLGMSTGLKNSPEQKALDVINDLSGELAAKVVADDSITGVVRQAAELRLQANGAPKTDSNVITTPIGDTRLSAEDPKGNKPITTRIRTTAAKAEAARFSAELTKTIQDQGLRNDPEVKGGLSKTGEVNASSGTLGKPGVSGVVAEGAVVSQQAKEGKIDSKSGVEIDSSKGADPNTTTGASPLFHQDDPDGVQFILNAKLAMQNPRVAEAINAVGGLKMFLTKVIARGRAPELLAADASLQNSPTFTDGLKGDQKFIQKIKGGTKVPSPPEPPQVFLDKVKNAVLSVIDPLQLEGVDITAPGFFTKLSQRLFAKDPNSFKQGVESDWQRLVEDELVGPLEDQMATKVFKEMDENTGLLTSRTERASPGSLDLIDGIVNEVEGKPLVEMPTDMDLAAKEAGGPADALNKTPEQLESERRIYESNNENRLPPLLATGEEASDVNRFRLAWQKTKEQLEEDAKGFRTSRRHKRNAMLHLDALRTMAQSFQNLEVQKAALEWVDSLSEKPKEVFRPDDIPPPRPEKLSRGMEFALKESEAKIAAGMMEGLDEDTQHLTPAPGGFLKKGRPAGTSAQNATRTDLSKYRTPPEDASTAQELGNKIFYVDGTDPSAVDALRAASGEQLFMDQIKEGGVRNELTGTIKEIKGQVAEVEAKLQENFDWNTSKNYKETAAALRDSGQPDGVRRFLSLMQERRSLLNSIQKQKSGTDPNPSAKPTIRYVQTDSGNQYAVIEAVFYPRRNTKSPETMEGSIEAQTGRSVGHNPIPNGVKQAVWIPGSTDPNFTLKPTETSFTPSLGVPKTQADNAIANQATRGAVGRIVTNENGTHSVQELNNKDKQWYTVVTPDSRKNNFEKGIPDRVIMDDEVHDAYEDGMVQSEEQAASLEENYEPDDVVHESARPREEGFSGVVRDADVEAASTQQTNRQGVKQEVEGEVEGEVKQGVEGEVKQGTSTEADVQPNRGNLIRNSLLAAGALAALTGAGAYTASRRQKAEEEDMNTPEPPPITPAPQTSASRIRQQQQQAQPANDPLLEEFEKIRRDYTNRNVGY